MKKGNCVSIRICNWINSYRNSAVTVIMPEVGGYGTLVGMVLDGVTDIVAATVGPSISITGILAWCDVLGSMKGFSNKLGPRTSRGGTHR